MSTKLYPACWFPSFVTAESDFSLEVAQAAGVDPEDDELNQMTPVEPDEVVEACRMAQVPMGEMNEHDAFYLVGVDPHGYGRLVQVARGPFADRREIRRL
jgi:hypothetical protein